MPMGNGAVARRTCAVVGEFDAGDRDGEIVIVAEQAVQPLPR